MRTQQNILLVAGLVICYGIGQFTDSEKPVITAGLLLLVLLWRLAGSAITWTLHGR
ncbi:MAG TPA: hypothetical protein GXX56_01780 [Rhodocyclaceae bacterium]|nr:hypothetical protein [Rhodocyclaceae bacterium]